MGMSRTRHYARVIIFINIMCSLLGCSVGHTESGYIHCGWSGLWKSGSYEPSFESDKESWEINTYGVSKSVHVNFNTSYSSPPHVQLSIVAVWTEDKQEAYGVDVEHVDAQGFTVRCFTWDDDTFRVYSMDVAWSSTAADV